LVFVIMGIPGVVLFEIPLESGRRTQQYFRHLTRIYNHVNIDSLDLLHDSDSRTYFLPGRLI